MVWEESGFKCWGIWGTALVLFLFHANVYGMRPRSRFSSQPGFSSAAGGLSPRFHSSTLGDCLPFPGRE